MPESSCPSKSPLSLQPPLQPCLFIINIFFTSPSSSRPTYPTLFSAPTFFSPLHYGLQYRQTDSGCMKGQGPWGLGVGEGAAGGDIWRRAGVQALSFFLLVYKNVYLMPHKRPCAHLLPLPPPYAPSPTVETLEREALALGGETLMGEAAATGWVRCFCWVGGGDEEGIPISFY